MISFQRQTRQLREKTFSVSFASTYEGLLHFIYGWTHSALCRRPHPPRWHSVYRRGLECDIAPVCRFQQPLIPASLRNHAVFHSLCVLLHQGWWFFWTLRRQLCAQRAVGAVDGIECNGTPANAAQFKGPLLGLLPDLISYFCALQQRYTRFVCPGNPPSWSWRGICVHLFFKIKRRPKIQTQQLFWNYLFILEICFHHQNNQKEKTDNKSFIHDSCFCENGRNG